MGEMAQTFIHVSEIEWLAVLKCRAIGLSTSLFLRERRYSAKLSDRRRPISPMLKFTTFTARNAANDVGVNVKLCQVTKLDLGPEIDVAGWQR